MSDEQEIRLQDMDKDELLSRLEGGLFSLMEGDDRYGELFRVSAALGIKSFVREHMSGYGKDEIVTMFGDGEQVISEFIKHASAKGLLEPAGPES
jgi:hypothetical protein